MKTTAELMNELVEAISRKQDIDEKVEELKERIRKNEQIEAQLKDVEAGAQMLRRAVDIFVKNGFTEAQAIHILLSFGGNK